MSRYYYQVIPEPTGDIISVFSVLDNGNVLCFPNDPANRDYQEYLEWVEEGNVAEEWNPEAN